MDEAQITIRLAGPFPSADTARLLEALQPLVDLTTPAVVAIDLRSLGRVSASSAALLASAVMSATARGKFASGSTITAPRDGEVRGRLEELEVLDLVVNPDVARTGGHPGDGSRPCRRIARDDDPFVVSKSLAEAIAEVCQIDDVAQNAMWWALNEITQNIVDHAGCPSGGIAIAEKVNESLLEVTFVDHGVGVRASLVENPKYRGIESDLDALRAAVQAGVTGRATEPGGLGLFLTQFLLTRNGGSLAIRSGSARLEVGAAGSEESAMAHMPGTMVTLRFRTDRPIRLDWVGDDAPLR